MFKFSHSSERRRKALIASIHRSDQTGRTSRDWLDVRMADRERLSVATCLLCRQSRQHMSYKSLFALTLVLHHAEHYHRASRVAEYLFTKHPNARTAWLVAIVADRCSLVKRGYQLYGTQFRYDRQNGTSQSFPICEEGWRPRASILSFLK